MRLVVPGYVALNVSHLASASGIFVSLSKTEKLLNLYCINKNPNTSYMTEMQ